MSAMTETRKRPPFALTTFRERRIAVSRSIRDLEKTTGIHRARLSVIERGMTPSLAEHQVIEAVLVEWETVA